jgi:hypothetical protein
MKIEQCVRFERLSGIGESEMEQFDLAFNPIFRLKEYPDLLSALAEQGVVDFDAAHRIANALSSNKGDETDLLTLSYLQKSRHILLGLRSALTRDLDVDYSPTSPELLKVLLDARRQQIANIEPALDVCDRAIHALSSESSLR